MCEYVWVWVRRRLTLVRSHLNCHNPLPGPCCAALPEREQKSLELQDMLQGAIQHVVGLVNERKAGRRGLTPVCAPVE